MQKPVRFSKIFTSITLFCLLIALFPLQHASGMGALLDSKPLIAKYAVQNPAIGIWISGAELAQLPTSGTAWNALKAAADSSAGTPNINDQDSNNDVYVLAKALVYARTGEIKYRNEVVQHLSQAIGTEAGGRTLALGRNLVSYVIAADLINLPADASLNQNFRAWLQRTLTETLTDGRTLRQTQEERPENWGTHAGASRAAVARYLGDRAELDRSALVFRGFLGDRAAYSSFKYGSDLSWQCDPTKPVGVNPKGCVKSGHSIDGAMPDDMRRGGSFTWPPTSTGYPWEALQGVMVQAEILSRAGYPAWEWQDRAILRAVNFLYSINWKPSGDDEWQTWIFNRAYGTTYAAASPAHYGKNMGWTDWTHNRGGSTVPVPQPTAAQPTAVPTKAPTAVPTQSVPTNPTAIPQPTAVQPTAIPTRVPTLVPSGSSSLIKSITFEGGNLTDPNTGIDRVVGSGVGLNNSSAIEGVYSASFANASSGYLEESFTGVDQLSVSMEIKVLSMPSSGNRILQVSNSGTTIGNIVLQSNGTLQLRGGSTVVGGSSQPLTLNTVYRVGIRQTRGTGGNAILEGYLAPVGQAFSTPFARATNGAWTNQADRIRVGATTSTILNALVDKIRLDAGQMP